MLAEDDRVELKEARLMGFWMEEVPGMKTSLRTKGLVKGEVSAWNLPNEVSSKTRREDKPAVGVRVMSEMGFPV